MKRFLFRLKLIFYFIFWPVVAALDILIEEFLDAKWSDYKTVYVNIILAFKKGDKL